MRRTLALLIAAVAFSLLPAWLMVAPFAWILRDGLGPDSITSHGLDALFRFFFSFYWGPIFLALAALMIAAHRYLRDDERDELVAKPQAANERGGE